MKKKNVLKTLAGVGLACISGIGMVGCADLEVDQSKFDSLVQKGETFVDTQNGIDYKKLAEELQSYLDSEKKLTNEEIYGQMMSDVLNLVELSITQNYTYTNGNKTTRVEYGNDDTINVHHYTTNQSGQREKEVFKIITKETVTTYVKDVNLYSVNNIEDFDNWVVTCFSPMGEIAYFASVKRDWHNAIGHVLGGDVADSYTYLYEYWGIRQFYGMLDARFVDLFHGTSVEYTEDNGQHIYNAKTTDIVSHDGPSAPADEFVLHNSRMIMTNKSFEGVYLSITTQRGVVVSQKEERSKIVFDNQNQSTITIENKSEYRLAQDYFDELFGSEE